MEKAICANGLKLEQNGDGATCVSTCEKKTYSKDEKTKELQCVSECKNWWHIEQSDGLCEEEVWRRDTAIAVPIVVIILAAAGTAAYFIIKNRKSSSTNVEMASGQSKMVDKVFAKV